FNNQQKWQKRNKKFKRKTENLSTSKERHRLELQRVLTVRRIKIRALSNKSEETKEKTTLSHFEFRSTRAEVITDRVWLAASECLTASDCVLITLDLWVSVSLHAASTKTCLVY
ncbi:hypothetical protein AVEN_134706-2-1, partial [Araneus ventricosus]